MPSKPRVYISAPVDSHLTEEQTSLKAAVLRAIEAQGFDLQIFHERGEPADLSWRFDEANKLMWRCHGAAVLAFAKWHGAQTLGGEKASLPSEFNHFEGALAVAHDVPLLLVTDRNVRTSGITYTGGGLRVYFWPDGAGPEGVDHPDFLQYLNNWSDKVKARRKVFLGYCSKAKSPADAITLFVERRLKVDVLNYSMDFRAGPTILEQIETAARSCACALLLFTKDDEIDGAIDQALPRDNVIFEAGYFIRAIGKNRVAIIREDGAKMPADLGGVVYIPLKDRRDIASVETKIDAFLESAL